MLQRFGSISPKPLWSQTIYYKQVAGSQIVQVKSSNSNASSDLRGSPYFDEN